MKANLKQFKAMSSTRLAMKRISQDEEFSPEVNLEMSLVLKDLLLYLKVNEFLCVYDEIWYIGNRHDKRSGHLQQSGLHAYRWPFSLTTFARKKIFLKCTL